MAYQTGSVANGTALKTILTSFMTSNGYTLANGWYGKGLSSVRFSHCAEMMFDRVFALGNNQAYFYYKEIDYELHQSYSIGDVFKIHSTHSGWDQTLGTVSLINTQYVRLDFAFLPFSYNSSTEGGPGTYIEKVSSVSVLESLTIEAEGDDVPSVNSSLTQYNTLFVESQHWPVTYHMFASDTQISCILHYAGTKIKPLFIGEMVKVDSNAFVGGGWTYTSGHRNKPKFSQPAIYNFGGADIYTPNFNTYMPSSTRLSGVGMPWGGSPYVNDGTKATRTHCEIDGNVFSSTTYSGRSHSLAVKLCETSAFGLYYGYDGTTNQAQLVPIHLQHIMGSSLEAYIGYIDHMRLIRIDDYNIGDVITVGSDSWMVFPWHLKNTEERNGKQALSILFHHTGTFGFAIRYVP